MHRNKILGFGDSSLSTTHTLSYPKSLICRSIQNICSQRSNSDFHDQKKPRVYEVYIVLRPTEQFVDCRNGFCAMQHRGRVGIVSQFAILVIQAWYLMIWMPFFRVSGWSYVYELHGCREHHWIILHSTLLAYEKNIVYPKYKPQSLVSGAKCRLFLSYGLAVNQYRGGLRVCVLYIGQAFRYSPENAFYIFNLQIYFIIWYLLDRASLI